MIFLGAQMSDQEKLVAATISLNGAALALWMKDARLLDLLELLMVEMLKKIERLLLKLLRKNS